MRIEPLHAHLPWARIHELLPLFEELSLCAEVGLNSLDLDRMARRPFEIPDLITPPRPVTIHAPFNDLNPGAGDARITEVTRFRLLQTLDFAKRTGASLVVCHPGYEHWRYAGNIDLWLDASLKFWLEILARAEQLGCHIAVENVFDTHYEALLRLLKALDHPLIGHCFDIGHWHLFSDVNLSEWFDALGPHLKHLHLHDNTGTSDAHLPIGEGTIPFQLFWSEIAHRELDPSITLEAHHPEHLRRSCSALHALVSQPRTRD